MGIKIIDGAAAMMARRAFKHTWIPKRAARRHAKQIRKAEIAAALARRKPLTPQQRYAAQMNRATDHRLRQERKAIQRAKALRQD